MEGSDPLLEKAIGFPKRRRTHSAVKYTARKSLDYGIQGELGPLSEDSGPRCSNSIL